MANERIVRISAPGEDEEWERETDDDLRGVGASKVDEVGNWPWQVFVSMAEFVREEPLESEMRSAIDAALRSIEGVSDVAEEDREVWIVEGMPSGEALVRAASDAIDPLVDRAADLLEAME